MNYGYNGYPENQYNGYPENQYNSANNYVEPQRKSIIQFRDVVKEYKVGEVTARALNSINMDIYQGEIVLFLGTSGAGKSTALNLLGGLDKATSGQIIVNGKDITKFNDKKMLNYRKNDIGFIFQFYNLIQTLSAKDNVELVSELTSNNKCNAEELLKMVGLEHRINNYPSQMSGGEQQRVSIARALAKKPKILLADEPTGALDYNTTRQVLDLLVRICRQDNITLIIVTHNNFIVPIADVVYSFRSGEIISQYRNNNPLRVEELEW
ncbi:MAG: ABC transporter ATP-binding protein [Lachnospiraceae bacterium]|nr:ABC transporter ATP-binding protein [Lachnospiraceae bacterium]